MFLDDWLYLDVILEKKSFYYYYFFSKKWHFNKGNQQDYK